MNDFISWFVGGSVWAVRVRIALAALAVLGMAVVAAVDRARRGRQATRWKEYLFLLAATAAAVAFAIGNDLVTSTLSPFYFEIHEKLTHSCPDIHRLAVGVAVRGSWWVGLVLGVLLLMTNNPRKTLPQLPWRGMYAKLLYPLAIAALGSAAMGLLSWTGTISLPGDLDRKLADAREFNAVFAAHAGAYAGGVLGAIVAAVRVIRQRKKARTLAEAT